MRGKLLLNENTPRKPGRSSDLSGLISAARLVWRGIQDEFRSVARRRKGDLPRATTPGPGVHGRLRGELQAPRRVGPGQAGPADKSAGQSGSLRRPVGGSEVSL